jgi:hypothetical protein
MQSADLSSVTCTSAGNCVAVGNYAIPNSPTDHSLVAMAATETGGVWAQGIQITAPTGAPNPAVTPSDAYLLSVSCTSAGNCVAVGAYSTVFDGVLPMAVTETAGVWGQAVALGLPANNDTDLVAQNASFNGVSCISPGNCYAVGFYLAGTFSATSGQAMVATETAGVWGATTEFSPPANQTPTAGEADATLDAVTCTGPGSCIAAGSYTASDGSIEAMTATTTAGVWGQGSEFSSLPAGAASGSVRDASFDAIACTGAGDCTAGGGYVDGGGVEANGDQEPMAATETGGVWGPASEIALPSNQTTPGEGDQFATLYSISCTSPGDCVAGGVYDDSNGFDDGQALDATQTAGVWGPGTEITPLPSGASTASADQGAGLAGVDCTSLGNCVAVGFYEVGNVFDDQQAMVLTSVPSLSITTAALPAALEGSPYSTQLAASGGVGASYTWSISAGALPAGLTLNTSTGVISGTPTASGTFTLTAAAANAGPPAQLVTAAFSLTVTAPPAPAVVTPPPPNTFITKVRINSRHRRAKLTFTASGSATSFACALVRVRHHKHPKPLYTTCKTPKTYRRLKRGSYVFYVRASGPGGTDATPAMRRFTIS